MASAVVAAAWLGVAAGQAGAAVSLQAIPGSPFTLTSDTGQNPYPQAIVTGDFNGDGHRDVITANTHPNQCLSVLLGTGGGALQLARTYDRNASDEICDGLDSAQQHQGLAAADLNGDGNLDLVDAPGDVMIALGDGHGAFTGAPSPGAPDGITAVAVADLNRDGHPDLIEAGETEDASWNTIAEVATQLGNGDGTFQAPVVQTLTPGADPPDIAVADFTGDGRPDVALATDSEIDLLAGNGDGTLAAPRPVSTDGGATLTAADLNGDGHVDLVVGGPASETMAPAIRVLLNTGTGSFTEGTPPLSLSGIESGPVVAAGDIDGDGHTDLAVVMYVADPETGQSSGVFSVLLGNGDGTFQPARTFDTGTDPDVPAIAAPDGDAGLNVLVAGTVPSPDGRVDNGTLAVLRPVSAALPVITTGNATGLSTSGATLAGTVDTQGESGTYHFEYGTTTAYGSSTVPQTLAAASGARSASAQLTGLQPYTTYHYRLVATSGAGTTDGSDHTFTTAALSPQAETDPPSATAATSATLTGEVNPRGAPLTYHFEYGTTTGYGTSTAEQSGGAGSASEPVSATVSGLTAGTVYHYRIVATGPAGTVYGDDEQFFTPVSGSSSSGGLRTTSQRTLQTTAMRVFTDTPLQSQFAVLATCRYDCHVTLQSLTVGITPKGGVTSGTFDSYDIGTTATVPAGQQGSLAAALPLSARASIADALEHGATVDLGALVEAVGPSGEDSTVDHARLSVLPAAASTAHRRPVAFAGRRAAVAHARRGATAVVSDVPSGGQVVPNGGSVNIGGLHLAKHPQPHHWQVTITGHQTTTWHINDDSSDGDCQIISHGSGTQTITFTGTHAVTGYIGMSDAGIPLLATESAQVPLDLPVAEHFNRQGTYVTGVGAATAGCGAAGGGGGPAPQPDCGERTSQAQVALGWLAAAELRAGEDAFDDVTHPRQPLYSDCPFPTVPHLGDLALLSARDPSFPQSLVLTASASRHIDEIIHGDDHETLDGGYANTQVTYNITLVQLDCPAPLPGGLSAMCVDKKAKDQATKEAIRYGNLDNYATQSINELCNTPTVEDAKATGIACIVAALKEGYDRSQQQANQAIANDPPDPRYRSVAAATPAHLGHRLPKSAPPAVRALVVNMQTVTGLGRALGTTINRISGAYRAKSTSGLRRQNAAAVADARKMAALLSAQPALMHRAHRALLKGLPRRFRLLARLIDDPRGIAAARAMAAMLRRYAGQPAAKPPRQATCRAKSKPKTGKARTAKAKKGKAKPGRCPAGG